MTPSLALILLSALTPTAEMMLGIPLGLHKGYNPLWFIPAIIVVNSLIYLPYRLLLDKGLSRVKFIAKQIDKLQAKGKKYIDKYGFWGITLYVGIPAPFTGVYTGTLLSWIFKLDYKKAYLAMLIGCTINGAIVAGVYQATGFILFKVNPL